MTYYDHGTALACKLDRWSEGRKPRNFELEAAAREQTASVNRTQRESVFTQLLKIVRYRNKESQVRPQCQKS